MQYQVLNNWRMSQSRANRSPVPNSLLAGNLHGIFTNLNEISRKIDG